MSLLTKLLAEVGETPQTSAKNSTVGRIFSSEPVPTSDDLQRINRLPRRVWQQAPTLLELRQRLSIWLRKPGSKEELYLMQAAALQELHDLRRCNTVAGLGTGKTLVSALAPTVVGAKRPLFLNYARLMDKTRREFRVLQNDWRICTDYDFLSVERFSRTDCADYLDRHLPDFICVDECQSLKAFNGARFRRLRRYKEAHPETIILLLTATPGTDSLNEYAHLNALVHGLDSPLPLDEYVLRTWCEATDAQVQGFRRPPGALTIFSEGDSSLEAVRSGIGRRIEETPGNIYFRQPEGIECSLYINDVKFDGVSERMHELCDAACHFEQLPDGRSFEEMYDKSLILKQLGCGFAKVLDPAPPAEWRSARQLLGSFVREIISQEKRYRFDTPLQVVNAIRSGELDDRGLYRAWREIEPTFTPTHSTEWFDLSVVEYCASWLAAHKGLVWVTFPTFGRKLAEVTGLPFFHAQGRDPIFGSIEEYFEPTGAILSLRANMFGRNLQRWSKNFFVAPPSSAVELDQSIGRTVRRGQKAETVEVSFLLTVRENWEAVQKARSRALADKALGRDQSSRLLLCDWCVSDVGTVAKWIGPRWER